MGKRKYIPSPEALYKLFEEYKEWAKKTPYKVKDWVGAAAKQVTREKERPLTWIGFSVYVSKHAEGADLRAYEANRDNAYSEYSHIITRIKDEVYQDQYDGAASGIFQQNIVARKLGLVDKQENKSDVTIKGVEVTVRKTGLPQINSEKDIPG